MSFCLAIFTLRESDRKIKRSSLSNLFSIRTFERGKYSPSYVIHVIKLFGSKKEAKMSGKLIRYLFISGFLMLAFQVFFHTLSSIFDRQIQFPGVGGICNVYTEQWALCYFISICW